MTIPGGPQSGRLAMVGLSYHTAPIGLRERLAISCDVWQGVAPTVPTVLLATCNRVEAYAWAPGRTSAGVIALLKQALGRASGVSLTELNACLMTACGRPAVVHLLRVAAGLDSLVLGEEHIRGQVREAYRAARECVALASPLDGVFSRVLEAARRIRAESPLTRHPSVATTAILLAARESAALGQNLAGRSTLVLGAGAMGKAAALALLDLGARVTLVNRTPEHAQHVARMLGRGASIMAAPLQALPELLAEAALVVGATAARLPVLDEPTVRYAMERRDGTPLLIVDIAVPRDVEPLVRSVPGVCLLDLDDLQRACPASNPAREAELRQLDLRLDQEVAALESWLRVRAIGPAIADLRARADEIRAREVRRSARRLKDLTPAQHQAVEALTQSLVNKLLHGPTVTLREAAQRPATARRSLATLQHVLRFESARPCRTFA